MPGRSVCQVRTPQQTNFHPANNRTAGYIQQFRCLLGRIHIFSTCGNPWAFWDVVALLNTGLAMECTALKVDGDALIATRTLYGGKAISEVTVSGTPAMATLRPNVVAVVQAAKSATVETVAVADGPRRTRVVEKKLESGSKVELTEADFVVSGGRAWVVRITACWKSWPRRWGRR